jgi:hypothetical protein
MASYLRPRRGKKATAIAQLTASAPLKRGELFFEVPDTGVGTGYGNIKMGDGSTGYDALPYFNKQVIVDDIITQASTNPVQSAAIYTALQNIEASITQLNNDLAGLSNKFAANINQVRFTSESTSTNIAFNINNTDIVVWKMDWVLSTIQLVISHDGGQTWTTVFTK